MKRPLQILLVLTGCALIPFFMFLFAWESPCSNNVVSSVKSPDGVYLATAFVRNCGATTGYSVHVFLGVPGGESEDVGNVFRGAHSNQIDVRWKSSRTLEIVTDAEPFLQMKVYSGINVEVIKPAPNTENTK